MALTQADGWNAVYERPEPTEDDWDEINLPIVAWQDRPGGRVVGLVVAQDDHTFGKAGELTSAEEFANFKRYERKRLTEHEEIKALIPARRGWLARYKDKRFVYPVEAWALTQWGEVHPLIVFDDRLEDAYEHKGFERLWHESWGEPEAKEATK